MTKYYVESTINILPRQIMRKLKNNGTMAALSLLAISMYMIII